MTQNWVFQSEEHIALTWSREAMDLLKLGGKGIENDYLLSSTEGYMS